jgi:hypothetical protein
MVARHLGSALVAPRCERAPSPAPCTAPYTPRNASCVARNGTLLSDNAMEFGNAAGCEGLFIEGHCLASNSSSRAECEAAGHVLVPGRYPTLFVLCAMGEPRGCRGAEIGKGQCALSEVRRPPARPPAYDGRCFADARLVWGDLPPIRRSGRRCSSCHRRRSPAWETRSWPPRWHRASPPPRSRRAEQAAALPRQHLPPTHTHTHTRHTTAHHGTPLHTTASACSCTSCGGGGRGHGAAAAPRSLRRRCAADAGCWLMISQAGQHVSTFDPASFSKNSLSSTWQRLLQGSQCTMLCQRCACACRRPAVLAWLFPFLSGGGTVGLKLSTSIELTPALIWCPCGVARSNYAGFNSTCLERAGSSSGAAAGVANAFAGC